MPLPRFVARIGDYGIEDELGRGAFGAVYRARDARTGEVVALKLFSRADGGAAALERFRQEPRALLRAGAHPNLLRVRAAGEHVGLPYFVMDYVAGRSVDDELAELGRLPWRRACSIARKISLALEHLHRAGFIHRDVKPANVLLDEAGEPRLIDLSLALDTARESRLTAAGQAVGTPLYMAPEQLRAGDELVSPATDVFALGVLLYELLTGAPPFWGETGAELIASIEARAVSPSLRQKDVPDAVSRVVLRALEPALAQRIPTAAAFTAELDRIATGSTVDARAPAERRGIPHSVPGYEVLEVCGRGGSGVVLRARDQRGALVAIKVLARTHEAALARFQREQRLNELLGETEGFVPFLGSGMAPFGPYVVMRFCEGGSLRDRLRKGPFPIDAGLELARRLAQAVGRAHEKGIVHRDLKPENVLFTSGDAPLVADLGLAKHFAQSPGSSQSVRLSESGALRGTAGYMPPEQARDARSVTPAADVFALGAIVYEIIAGQAPFGGTTFLEIVDRTENAQYEPLARVRPDAPPWLSRAVDRALSPDPADRWPDARALAAALVAPPRSNRRWIAVVGAVAAVLAVALVAALARRGHPERPTDGPSEGNGKVEPLGPTPGSGPIPAHCASIKRTKTAELVAVWGSYAWTHEAGQTQVAFVGDGSRAVTGTSDGKLLVWKIPTGDELAVLTAPSPGPVVAVAAVGVAGQVVTGSDDGSVTLWDTNASGPPLVLGRHEPPEGKKKSRVEAVAVSPDGKLAASGGTGGTVRLWDLGAAKFLREVTLGAEVLSLAFSGDGADVGAGCADGKVHVFSTVALEAPRSIDVMPGRVFALAARGARTLLAGGMAGPLVAVDLDTLAATGVYDGHRNQVHALAVSLDGRNAFSGGFDGVCLWDLVTKERRGPWAWGWVSGTAFSRDGKLALAARYEGPTVLVDVASGNDFPREGADGMVLAIEPLGEGGELATGGLDGVLRIWDVKTGKVIASKKGHRQRIVSMAALPDGRIVSASWDKDVRIWGQRLDESAGLETGGRPNALAVSPDRRLAAVGTDEGTLELFLLAEKRRIASLPTSQERVASVAFIGSARVATGGMDGSLRLWDIEATRPDGSASVVAGPPLPPHTSQTIVGGSADGRYVLSLSRESLALADLVRATSWVRELEHGAPGRASSLALSPDGKLAVGSFGDHTVRLWDLERRGEELDRIDLTSTSDEPFRVAFSRDRRYLLVGTKRGIVLWFRLSL